MKNVEHMVKSKLPSPAMDVKQLSHEKLGLTNMLSGGHAKDKSDNFVLKDM